MTITLSRRSFAGMIAALPIALALRPDQLVALSVRAEIGAKQSQFDSVFGPARTEGWFSVYDFGDEGQASYWVAWDANGFAHRIANDYSAIPGGGLPFSPGQLGQSQFLPNDAAINAAGDLTNLQVGSSGYYLAQHHSDQVQQTTGRSGNILVVDQRAIPGDGPNNPNFTATSVAMEAWEVNPVHGTGALPGLGTTYQQLEATFGSMTGHQRGNLLDTPPLPGRWMFAEQTIDIILDQPIAASEAAGWIGEFLPADIGAQTTTYWLPAPGDTQGLRVNLWTAANQMSTVALHVVHNSEETGTVSRMIIGQIAPAVN